MKFSKLSFSDIPVRLQAVVAAILVYAFFGSPTPDSVSWAEIAAGLLLAFAVGPGNAVRSATLYHLFFPPHRGDVRYGYRSPAVSLSFFYLLTVPFLIGLAYGVSGADMIRDVIPMLFLFLPFLISGTFTNENIASVSELLKAAACAVGVAFSFRFLVMTDIPLWAIGSDLGKDNMLYLSAEPCVLFAAIYLPLYAFDGFFKGNFSKKQAAVALAGGMIAVTVMAATMQRAGLFFVFTGFAVYASVSASHSVRKLFVLIVAAAGFFFVFRENITGVFIMAAAKTAAVWDNSRFAELGNVVDAVSEHWDTMFFGKGWGSVVYSPAAGHVWVRYTHMMSGYFLLKTGFVGLIMLFIYGVRFVGMILRLFRTDAITAYALFAPLFCGAVFTTGFKLLGFGLLLCISAAASAEKSKENQ